MDLDKVKLVSIVGDLNTGKTNLAIYLLREYQGNRKIYLLGYPKPIDKFKVLQKKQEIDKLQNAIIFIDELSRFFPLKGNHSNDYFLELVRLTWHNNMTIIFTTQLSQDLTKKMESFIDGFLFTRIDDLRSLKNGSRIKNTVLDFADIRRTTNSLLLAAGEYMEYSVTNEIGDNGVKSFPFQNIGKDWNMLNTQSNAKEFAHSFASDVVQEGSRYTENKNKIKTLTLQEIESELIGKPDVNYPHLKERACN
jgi:hypothetical protein